MGSSSILTGTPHDPASPVPSGFSLPLAVRVHDRRGRVSPLVARLDDVRLVADGAVHRAGVLPREPLDAARQLPPTDTDPLNCWTERDKLAWSKIAEKANSFEKIEQQATRRPQTLRRTSQLDLAKQVSEIYNPGSADPFEHLTLPEVLTCIELAMPISMNSC